MNSSEFSVIVYISCSYLEPMLHVVCTGIGCYIGYTVHRYEETAEERTERMLALYKHAPKLWAAQLTRDENDDDDDDDDDDCKFRNNFTERNLLFVATFLGRLMQQVS